MSIVVSNINWEVVDEEKRSGFTDAVTESWEWILGAGQPCEMLAQLIAEGLLGEELITPIKERLDGPNRASFDFRLGSESDFMPLLNAAVTEAEEQLDINDNKYQYSMFAINPYALIDFVVNKVGIRGLEAEVVDRLFSLFRRAADTSAPDEVLGPMLGSMAACAACYIREHAPIPDVLTEAVGSFRKSSHLISGFMLGGRSEQSWKIQLLSVRALCGLDSADEIITAYLSSKGEYESASALAKMMPYLLSFYWQRGSKELQSLALVLSELAMDSHPEVRKLVPQGAVELLTTPESEYGHRLLMLFVRDNDPEVRISVLRACEDVRVESKYRSAVRELLAQDANYHLRHHANKTLQ